MPKGLTLRHEGTLGDAAFVSGAAVRASGVDEKRNSVWACDAHGWATWWRLEDGALVHKVDARRPAPCGEAVFAAAFASALDRLLVLWGDGLLTYFDVATGKRLWERDIEIGNRASLVMASDGKRAFVETEWPTPRILQIELADRAARTAVSRSRAGALERAKTKRASGAASQPRVEQPRVEQGRAIVAIASSRDGHAFVATDPPTEAIGKWKVGAGKLVGTLAGLGDAVRRLLVTPDGRAIVGASWGYRAKPRIAVWSVATGVVESRYRFSVYDASVLAIAPHDRRVLVAGSSPADGNDGGRRAFVGLLDLAKRTKQEWVWKNEVSLRTNIVGAFSPRGTRVLLASGDTAWSVDARTGTDEKVLLRAGGANIDHVLPGIAVGRTRNSLVAWPLSNAAKRWPLMRKPLYPQAVASRGEWLAVAAGSSVSVWSMRQKRRVASLDLALRADQPTALEFRADALLVGTARGVVERWVCDTF